MSLAHILENNVRHRPILFSTPMVHGLLAGMKTQTRRIVKPQPDDAGLWDHTGFPMSLESTLTGWRGTIAETGEGIQYFCPYGQPGDLLWVRETFTYSDTKDSFSDDVVSMAQVLYKASNDLRPDGISIEDFGAARWVCLPEEKVDDIASGIEDEEAHGERWKPSIHMPKAAARLWLRIKSIRVERLKDISEQDALAEGIERQYSELFQEMRYRDYFDGPRREREFKRFPDVAKEAGFGSMPWPDWRDPITSFDTLWQSINGEKSLEANPWVWVIEFEVLSMEGAPSLLLLHSLNLIQRSFDSNGTTTH